MKGVKEKEGEVMEMREEEQVLPTVPRIGLALCPFVVLHKEKNDWPYHILTIR